LVILRAQLSADTPLPAIVPLPIPTAAGAPHAVAKQAANGSLLVAQYTIEVDGEWSKVNLLTDVRGVRLEYYIGIDPADPQRRHRFYWPGQIAVERLLYEVLHPVGATNMSVTPPADTLVEADGLTFYRAELGAKQAGEPFSIALAYAKSTPQLSSPAAQAAPPAPAPSMQETAPTQAPAKSWTWLPLALIGLAVIVGLWLMFRRPPATPAD
jgi:hypothetical protein